MMDLDDLGSPKQLITHHHANPGLQVSGALLSKARHEAQNASAVSVMETFPIGESSSRAVLEHLKATRQEIAELHPDSRNS